MADGAQCHTPASVPDPAIMLGKPCVKGTRITVELILKWIAAGRSFAELIEAYPFLTPDGIEAALAYAAEAVNRARVMSPPYRPSGSRSTRGWPRQIAANSSGRRLEALLGSE